MLALLAEADPDNILLEIDAGICLIEGNDIALDDIEMSLSDLSERGLQIVVTHLDVRFREPATARDVLNVETRIAELKRVSSTWKQIISRESDGKELVEAELTLGVCDLGGKPTRPPSDLNVTLSRLMNDHG